MNFNQQINALRQDEAWSTFIFNALHLYSKKPQHKTHCIRIDFEFGFQLGKLSKLIKYEVLSLQAAHSMISDSKTKTPEEKRFVLENCLDVERSPRLLASRAMYPRNILIPVLFINQMAPFFLTSPNLSEFIPETVRPKLSIPQSHRQAELMFQRLQQYTESALPPGAITPNLD
ncbi:MAG: hypothetical protein SGILL_004548 [Bacillariaceae sp.]